MNIENINGYSLQNLARISILMGKNGCGKSTVMRLVAKGLNGKEDYGNIKYISPERGGFLIYEPNIELAMAQNPTWMSTQRSKNQAAGFKPQTIAQYRNLETLILRRHEKDNSQQKFDVVIDKINKLLENLQIKREGLTFKIYSKDKENEERSPEKISSGESELISLAIECLIFKQEKKKEKEKEKQNILFLDEPDVHLHPDLQVKLMHFLNDLVKDDNELKIIIATHSTAIVGAFSDLKDVRVCFMRNQQKELNFQIINEIYKKILPIFGAHPLSNIFNAAPIFIVEGEDDVRIWQQVVRSSKGKIQIYPCEAGTIDKIHEMEQDAKQIINSVYDNAKGYSLRDKDKKPEEIEDDLPIIKFRLSCRNAENLILSNEALLTMGVNWDEMKQKIVDWTVSQESGDEKKQHQNFLVFKNFKDCEYNRKQFDLKKIRNDLLHIAGCNKPWEVLVGQSIASNLEKASSLLDREGSIFNYLGKKITEKIILNQ